MLKIGRFLRWWPSSCWNGVLPSDVDAAPQLLQSVVARLDAESTLLVYRRRVGKEPLGLVNREAGVFF